MRKPAVLEADKVIHSREHRPALVDLDRFLWSRSVMFQYCPAFTGTQHQILRRLCNVAVLVLVWFIVEPLVPSTLDAFVGIATTHSLA